VLQKIWSAPEVKIEVPQSPPSNLKALSMGLRRFYKSGNSRLSWFITADYDIGGGDTKRTELNIRSVKIAEVAKIPPVAPAALQVVSGYL
jgi:hypothetical protein